MVFRIADWPLHVKIIALFVGISLLPVVIAAAIDLRSAHTLLTSNIDHVLQARGDQLVRELDDFNRGYSRVAVRLALLPDVRTFCGENSIAKPDAALRTEVSDIVSIYPKSDSGIRGVSLLDHAGRVILSDDRATIGVDLSHQPHVVAALQGKNVISDVFVDAPSVGETPTIAYLAPVVGDAQTVCVVVLWIQAQALWNVFKASNALAGEGSFAVMFDQFGIRIAHTYNDEIIFHPGGELDPMTKSLLIAQHRFGARTQALLDDVRDFPEQFDRARSQAPDLAMFHGFAPVNQTLILGVARRFATVPWTVFYMVPSERLYAPLATLVRNEVLLTGTVILFAALLGVALARSIVRPIQSLVAATASLSGGDLKTRVQYESRDELGQLGDSFNAMAERIEAQSIELRQARDDLEERVQERTAELRKALSELKSEIEMRRKTEEAIAESKRLLQAIIDNTTAVIYVKDLAGHYLLVNRRFCELFHFSYSEVLGRTDHDLFPQEAADQFRAIDVLAAEATEALIEEEVAPHDDGNHAYISVKCPLRDAQRQVVGVFGISTDITERKHAEAKLQANLEHLNLLDQITCAIGERQDLQSIYQVVIRSLESRLRLNFCCICRYDNLDESLTVMRVGVANLAMSMELALTENARIAIDRNGLSRCVRGELVYEPDVSVIRFPFPQRLARGGMGSVVIAPLQSKSRVFGVLIAARRDRAAFSSGECEFLRQLCAHVALAAEQAQLHMALQQAYDDLRQTQQAVLQQERLGALGQMASGIAHDINNAISPAALYCESLLESESELSAKARGYLQTVARAIDDVAATVARMREFCRQREPQMTLLPMQLNILAEQVLDLTRARWNDIPQRRGNYIHLKTEFAPRLPEALGVESEVREALTNLIFNAVDAMPEGGVLTVRTHANLPDEVASVTKGLVAIEVSDTGTGMDESTRRHCMEPFFTTKGERGTGLGLAMVYGMAQRHGAEIDIESTIGRGTSVRLSFAPATAPEAPESKTPELHRLPTLRILLVDDDPLLLKSLSETLEGDGHLVATAHGGQAGINAFLAAQRDSNAFEVVITDLGMPYVDGRRVAESIKQVSPNTPVILLTGWGQRLMADGERPAHVDYVLSKPPKLREVREALAYSLKA